jgi:N6-L-threonylcarbamoyladenine synthase
MLCAGFCWIVRGLLPPGRRPVVEEAVVLAVETSCDETAAAVLRGTGSLLGSCIFSQAALHAGFGGVVPEVASRSHLEALPEVLRAALKEAQMVPEDPDFYAATTGPGLAPALLVGAAAARGMAAGARRPFIGVNHLEGHLLSPFFGENEIPPHAALVVSGGHTLLFDVSGYRKYRLLGRTLDDAAGEAFDKAAKLLGLGYPGGAAIEKLAADGNPHAVRFPRGLGDAPHFDFSFSGLKTSLRVFLEKDRGRTSPADICASFQEAVADVLALKLSKAAVASGHHIAAISGGVSSNAAVQSRIRGALAKHGIELRVAAPALRTDNAAMIAFAAALAFASGKRDAGGPDISPNFNPEDFPGF